MQPIRNTRSENRWARSGKCASKRGAAIGLNAETKRANWDVQTRNSPANSNESVAMRRLLSLLCSVAALATWSPTSFAQQQVISGPTPTQLSPVGVTNGVSMVNQGGGGTLLVGTVGGPETDIYTNNNPVAPGSVAVLVNVSGASLTNVTFNSSSTVYGAISTSLITIGDLSAGANGTTVNFLGPINVTSTFVTGTGTLNFNNAGGATIQNGTPGGLIFQGNGTVVLAANTYLNAAGGITTTAANTGNLTLNAGSIVEGAVGDGNGLSTITVNGGTNTTGVSAYIGPTLATGGAPQTDAVNAYTFKLNTNTLNITGALTIAASTANGVIYTTLASPTLYGKILTNGALNLGPQVLVNVTVPSAAILPKGTIFYIVTPLGAGTPGIPITVVDLTNPNSKFTGLDAATGQIEITNQQAFVGPFR